MPRASWNGVVIAEAPTEAVTIVEGNVYFPRTAVRDEYLASSDTHTFCHWKGTASYYDVVVPGARNPDAAWYYPEPMVGAEQVSGRLAFWRGVIVER